VKKKTTVQRKWWMRILCFFGIHWAGASDGGGMGDAYSCDVCDRDSYFPCFLLHDRAKGSDLIVESPDTVEEQETCDHLYFPVSVDGNLIGQECSLCRKFNSLEDVMRHYKEKGL
jgi:hypothetical protein